MSTIPNVHQETINKVIQNEKVFAAFSRAYTLTDYSIHNNLDKRHGFRIQTINNDESLNNDEKKETIRILSKRNDCDKILFNEGKERTCENCQERCLATLYCEHCIRNCLKSKFSNWTSGNNDIDNLIQKCQLETISPNKIIEWIPYENLSNIEYFTKGGISKIYSADWIGGNYSKWDPKEKQLKRHGTKNVIVKKLENVENANRDWFEEAKSHITISNKWAGVIQCYGLTQDPLNESYMLVMYHMNIDLRNYLQQNHKDLTWKKRIKIVVDIIDALLRIHNEKAIHRDLHSGNILYLEDYDCWYIGDLGFCGPVDKPLGNLYGNLPYIAPEVMNGKECTFASDIYSIAMLMWEISSGQPPFANYKHDYDLAMNIINGMRPKIVSETPFEYKKLMEQCWDDDPLKRPDINTLYDTINKLNKSFILNESNCNKMFLSPSDLFNPISTSLTTNYASNRLFTSKVYQFENLPEPKNATEVFHSKPYDFTITSDMITKILKIFKKKPNNGNQSYKKRQKQNIDIVN
ncbi:kinase-like domain-containing protein [Glomus cerebriforme]|uniref:Kinase-like domain-containing protein n=1 Tax=Glomus cerebriforme TaxID=658196 RepID=A0A397S1D7_9GLOM|nr:kinase-like domain-containing protein [Glomus cerebriforme]